MQVRFVCASYTFISIILSRLGLHYTVVLHVFLFIYYYYYYYYFILFFPLYAFVISFVYMSILPKTYITGLYWFVERDIHCTTS